MHSRILFKVEKKRVLVPVGEPCPFGCRYCYARGGEVGLARVDMEDVLSRFRKFALDASFETIQFGYDGDPFARPERGIAMLRQLALVGKHMNFSTKALIEGSTLAALQDIRRYMDEHHTVLSALVSLSCWDSATVVEPHTPTPAERMRTVANLTSIGIPAFITLRPILPHISDTEYERVVIEGVRAGSEGFVVGPLYSDRRGQFVRFIPPETLASVSSQTTTVSWSPHAPTWTRYEDTNRLQGLISMIERCGGRAFESSADVMTMVQQRAVVK
ncbi:MAG TPA: radical SAM protein [Ktedonobacteraceae bacterium]|nr:radical SAM protein [Ktedonobacteraceae bacterium]